MKNLIALMAGVVLAVGVLWVLKPAEEELVLWHKYSDKGILVQMEKTSLKEVHRYVNWVQAEELPPNYIIQAHVANAKGIRQARASVNHRYPQFQNVHNDELLHAVRENPLLYREYIRETKSIRTRFGLEREEK